MNEPAENTDGPLIAVPDCVVARILGRLEVDGAKVVGRGAGNSTRWIFDVEANGGEEIVVTLLKHFGRRKVVRLDIYSITFTPHSASFYDAQPVVEVRDTDEGSVLVLTSQKCEKGYSMRVTVDAVGTSQR
jgi:hypothetical protein